MNPFGLFRQLNHLKSTVRSNWGAGPKAWFNFIFYGMFRVNKFIIMKVGIENQIYSPGNTSGVTIFNPLRSEIDRLRSGKILPREFFCDQYHKVTSCCMAKVGGELAYIHWVYLKGDYSRFLKIGSNSAEINYVLTLPEFRGRRISTAAFNYTMQTLRQIGIKNIFAVVHNNNIASIKSFERAGFSQAGSIVSICHLNWKVSV